MRLVNPTGTVNDRELGARAATNASWPEALSGLKIGILSNSKPKVASLFDHLSVALHARGVETTCSLIKPGPTVPASTEQISELARSTEVVIAGVCDGGTAASGGAAVEFVRALPMAQMNRPDVATILICGCSCSLRHYPTIELGRLSHGPRIRVA
jgi:hypothetical protein